MEKRGADPEKFYETVEKLANGKVLELRYEDHPLKGRLAGKRDCHIEPDWLLMYSANSSVVKLIRTGTHSDLFE